MIIERHNVVAQKAVMPKKMPKHKKIVVEDDIQVYCLLMSVRLWNSKDGGS